MRLNSNYHVHQIAGEHIIIRPGATETDLTGVISLNTTAAWLWEQFADGQEFTVDDIAAALATHYTVDEEKAKTDAEVWIRTLEQHNLLLL